MSNTSRDEPTLIFVFLVGSEVQVLSVIVANQSIIDTKTLCQLENVILMTLQIRQFAVKLNFELFFSFSSVDLVNATSHNVTHMDFSIELLIIPEKEKFVLADDSAQSILETTYYFDVSNDFSYCTCHNLTYLERPFSFVNQQVEQNFWFYQIVHVAWLPWVFKRCSKLVNDVLNHELHVALVGHVELLEVSLGVQRVKKVRISDHLLAEPILLRLVNIIRILILRSEARVCSNLHCELVMFVVDPRLI
jgi:hypothetical protein